MHQSLGRINMKKSCLCCLALIIGLLVASCNNKEPKSYCTYNGFEPETKLAFWDHPWYDFILMSGIPSNSNNEAVTYLDMQFYKDYGSRPKLGKTGKFTIDVDPNNCGTCLVISTNCVAGICKELYFAGEGDFEIDKWGNKGETFSGSLKNAVFFQIEPDENGYYRYMDEGKIWCVDDYVFETTVQSVYDIN
jgi:hypothetical protein